MQEDIIEQGRAAAEAYNGSGKGFHNKNRINAYVCDGGRARVLPGLPQPGCGYFIITIDRDFGVTPFMVGCGNCGGMAYSKMYRVAVDIAPTHEWYRPNSLDGIDEGTHEHIRGGGLLLRPIEGRGAWLRPEALNLSSMTRKAVQ